jgi:hypothetical protein
MDSKSMLIAAGVGGLLRNLVLYPLFGAIGGAIATGIIWKKK